MRENNSVLNEIPYNHNGTGNRLSKPVCDSHSNYTNVTRVSLISVNGMGFTWDDNGNLLTWDDGEDDWTYRYDPEDRLINVKKNGDLSAVYTYDADGRRVRSWFNVSGVTELVVYNAIQLLSTDFYIISQKMRASLDCAFPIHFFLHLY